MGLNLAELFPTVFRVLTKVDATDPWENCKTASLYFHSTRTDRKIQIKSHFQWTKRDRKTQINDQFNEQTGIERKKERNLRKAEINIV